MPKALRLLPIACSGLFLVGCDDTAAPDSKPEVAATNSLWEVGPTEEADLREALSACVSIVRNEDSAATTLMGGGWSERPLPEYVDDTMGKTIFEHTDQSELIAVGSDQTIGTTCSVLSSASHTMLLNAVADLEPGFADTMQMLPHGPIWRANGVIINNDYANFHVFQPEVLDPEDYFRSELSDIRIFRCQEQC